MHHRAAKRVYFAPASSRGKITSISKKIKYFNRHNAVRLCCQKNHELTP